MPRTKNVTPPAELALIKAEAATPEARLDVIAEDIRAEYGKGIEASFAIGRLLSEARSMFPADQEFGSWFNAQEFPFGRSAAYNLRVGAEREPEVRALLASRETTDKEWGVTTAVKQLLSPGKKSNGEVIPVTDTTPADPVYAALRQAHRLIVVEGGFSDMHIDDLTASAGFIKELVAAYQSEKAARAV